MRKGILALVVATIACLLTATTASAQAPAPKVLVFHGTPDATVNAGLAAIEALGTNNGFDVDDTANAGDFTAANLAQYRAIVVLGNSGNDALNAAQETALQAYIQNGGGFVGIGGAAEAEAGSTFFGNLIGARPAPASPTGTSEQIVAVGDRVHPATKSLPLEWRRTDVWYQWQQRPTGQVHTVARYHAPNAPAGDGTAVGGTDWPISWCRDFQGGRSFYTGMGRTAASFDEANFRTHLLGAIEWSTGMLRAGCKATIAANYTGQRLVDGSSGDLTHTGEAHGVAAAPNGWMIYIGRGDCRTNAQRGAMIGTGPTDRILDFANRNVGIGCGDVHVFDPQQFNGTVNSGDTLAGILPVYGDRGGGAEINGKFESGMLGVTVAPDFATTGHIYLQWFPTLNPDNPVHPGVADGDTRRITKMGQGRISRFTINLQTKKLDLDSEVVIFTYDTQIWSCCHQGGGMGFDSEGNLYVTVGDSNSSQSTNGYSGNYQPAHCPTGDPNTATNTHCGANGISYNDARRTAGSTNDYNGKMLRFNPIDTIADGAQPTVGVNSTYTLPNAQSPNGPNLFDGTEGGGGKTKPESYAMGLRNPSRLFIDPATDIPYSAWVGPDAGAPSATQGPSTYENATQLASAGNYGWPYCMGNQQPYRDRIADGSLRTTNVAGYVNGGPAGAPTPGWYDCDNLVNDSTNNTGLTVLPHVTGTGKDAGTTRSTNLWYSRGNPNGANGCPDFPRELGANLGPNYGANPTQLCPYLTASGATVFNGPVYRFDDDAQDNSARWPEYWDGRWFLQDFSNNSAKHALLLDPATDQDGGKPVYADSFRGVLNWQNNYMDSKFGADGALYVQVYDGFFTTGPGAGLYKFSYTGGPDTPNPDPQWSTTSTARQIRFSLGRSGGVSYQWNFGDGSAPSTEATPLHTYAAAGSYNATLEVTYADGEKLSRTVEVIVGDDTAAPTTTSSLDGDGPVEVTLSATDGAGTGVEWTEYRIDGGAFTRHDNTAQDSPFVTTFTVSGDGTHLVEFRSRDRSGNVEDPLKQVSFTIDSGGGGGSSCLPSSDEFDGSALDAKWSVLRQAGGGPVVANGSVGLPILQGDFIANDPLASNTLLQDAPTGPWTVTARLDTTELNANGEQAGLVIWKSENPNTFSKIVAIQSNGGNKQFEHIVTQNGGVNPPIANSITPAPGGQMPEHVLLRARFDGTKVIGEFSPDEGESWTLIGQENHAAPFTAPLRVGLAAFRGGTGGGTATFDWFRVHEGAEPGGPVQCAGVCQTRSDEFDGALDTSRWSFRHPTTPATGARAPKTEGGKLAFPLGQRSIDQSEDGPVAFLGQTLPEGDFTVEAKINAAGLDTDVSRTDDPYAQVGLGLYQTDGDWIGIYQTRNGDNGNDPQGTYFEVKYENAGARTLGNRIGQADASVNLPNYYVRATRTGDNLKASYSLDGTNWTDLEVNINLADLFDSEDGPVYIGPLGANGQVTVNYEYIRFTPDGDCPNQCNPLSDQFSGTELDPKWELVNPNADPAKHPAVADGHLKLPLVPGDLFGGSGDAQMILQQAPAESWVATAKIAHANIDSDGEAAGLALVNQFNPNYFVKTGVQYKSDTGGGQPGKWAERVLTSNGEAVTIPPETVPYPNSGALNLTGDFVYARFVYDAAAKRITTWTSTNGTTFTQFGQPLDVAQYLNQPGGLKVGLFGKHDGSGDDVVDVDAFNVVSGTTDPQTPGDDCGAAEQCPQNDEFDGTALDDKWEVINPNPEALSVGGGNLTLTSAVGDVRNTAFTAQNIVLQDVPEGPWTATMKFDHTALALNGQAAGMVLYGQQNPNYFAKVATQYKNTDLSGNPMNGIWIERTLTSNGASNTNYGGAFPNTGKLTPPTNNLWIRTSYDGTNVITEYSLDGDAWAAIAPPVPADQYGPNGVTKIGLFVKHDNGGTPANVKFDSFHVEAESCGEVADTTPPRTTHTLDPATPDGQEGWYKTPVKVTLDATDNEGGSGVDFTEYRFAPTETWTRYSGPITVDDEGRQTLQYRSTDKEGNVESTRSVTLRIDPNAPTTTAKLNGAAPVSNYDGPVDVDLDATDGAGSGVKKTEIRVDGGEWKPYVEEETILNSAADLGKWEQAGPGGLNWMTDEGGFARTTGGLGMPWYAVKDFGDFSLKLQWRDSSTGTNGNSGIFARFPNPTEAVQRPPAQRYPCQVGSAQSDPAWVAIYCGHEIQINDHQGDVQKTGSIYNFSPNDETAARIQPRGTWVDYELRVVGQHYTIIRNGTVIKEFENAPDQQSSRAGDPSTTARQFARGYIGLQNHSNADVIDFRNVRVLALDEGSVRGPVRVEGNGAHTVEYRSTDVAGNQEAIKKVDFTIGGAADDETAPVTTHALDPAQPGAGGTYNGPVDVTLSATDPAEGGAEPVTHDVNANGFSWNPSSFDATTGDTVRWNFPEATAGFPHDVWVIKPGEAPDSEGHQIAQTTQPGGASASTTVDQAGDWTYVCHLHSSVQQGRWTGMVGTAHVAAGSGGGEASGVDFTEYRVDGGAFTRHDNTGNADPFATTFTVDDEGSHVVEYRSTDNAGNVEATKSVAFSIQAADPDAPEVEGFADPATGAAPLRVQFSATGLDPQGGEITYEWDFGDGSGSFNQSPEHVYTKAGTYTATVTGTDPQGKSGTDTVTIVVTPAGGGNQAPDVRATADPKTGQAPLGVSFSAQATDPEGGPITYLWNFDDNGANAFGRNATHTYTRPGEYHATVTATDNKGAFDTAEVVITVENPPGNVAPIVQAAATPRSGTAPLRVSFTSSAVDPDGDQVSTVWDFGDGVKGGGANIAHTYTQPGSYTATVTVKDPGGLTDTDSVTITVTATSRGVNPGSRPPVTGEEQGESPDQPLVRAPRNRSVQSVIKRGLRLKVSCDEACRARSVLRVSGERLGASKRLALDAGESRTLVVRLDRSVRKNLIAAMRQAGIRRLKAFAVTKVVTADGTRNVRVKVMLKR
ncbi:MAG TPA: PKD domain-containing protein [Solirubrobacteraceae bacterium]|nr:PKD domain-containing protein [Solirubrobacteraceae bacterium]